MPADSVFWRNFRAYRRQCVTVEDAKKNKALVRMVVSPPLLPLVWLGTVLANVEFPNARNLHP